MPMPSPLSPLRAFACALLLVVTAAGASAAAKGDVNDLFAAGGEVTVDEPVTGDAMLAGGNVDIHAPVSDRLRVAGGDVTIDSAIGSKVSAAGGKVHLGPDAVIGGDAHLYGGSITVDGRVEGNLHVSGGQVTINGQVRGDVIAHVGSIQLGPEARIGGVLRYTSRNDLRMEDGALVSGAIVHEKDTAARNRGFTVKGPGQGFGIAFFALVLAAASLLLWAAPAFGARAADRSADSPTAMIALGLGSFVALPIVLVLLCITIIGIPIAIAVVAALPVVLLLAFVVSVLGLARRLPAMFRQPAPQRLRGQVAWYALALAAVLVVGTVPVLGWLVMFLFLLAGFGAFVLELPRRRRAGGPKGGSPAGRPLAA